jgi:hypothetical protein
MITICEVRFSIKLCCGLVELIERVIDMLRLAHIVYWIKEKGKRKTKKKEKLFFYSLLHSFFISRKVENKCKKPTHFLKFKNFYSYVVERQKIDRKPFFINFSKKTFFDHGVILSKLTFFGKKLKNEIFLKFFALKKRSAYILNKQKKFYNLNIKENFFGKKLKIFYFLVFFRKKVSFAKMTLIDFFIFD